jgi:hypothetical protein
MALIISQAMTARAGATGHAAGPAFAGRLDPGRPRVAIDRPASPKAAARAPRIFADGSHSRNRKSKAPRFRVASQADRDFEPRCDTARIPIFQRRKRKKSLRRQYSRHLVACRKNFTYPSCDPALNAGFVNIRLVIRLSPISMDTAGALRDIESEAAAKRDADRRRRRRTT